MKTTLFLSLLFLSITLWAQPHILGIDKFKNASDFKSTDLVPYETWVWVPENNAYGIGFQYSVVGYKHAMEKIFFLLSENNIQWSDYEYDNSLLPEYADGIFDYSSVFLGLQVGSAEVKMGWDNGKVSLFLYCGDDNIMILAEPL